MQAEWWEDPLCWLCDYWLLLVAGLALVLGMWFSRAFWVPLVLGPAPTATPQPTATNIPPTVTAEPELGTGDVQVTLRWNSLNDLDLWVTDPDGRVIFYNKRRVPSGGSLDVDSNADCRDKVTRSPVENIFWPQGLAPRGNYRVEVLYFKHCAGAPLSETFTVSRLVDGKRTEASGVITENIQKTVFDFRR